MKFNVAFAAIVAAALFVPISAAAEDSHRPKVEVVPNAVEPVEYVRICEAFATGFCVLNNKPASARDCEKNGGKVEARGDKTICIFSETK